MRSFSRILVTGGAGFIGSNFIRWLFNQPDFNGEIITVDKLTYAGKRDNLSDIESLYGKNKRFTFYHHDICDIEAIDRIITVHDVDAIIHFAAETHVDRSIYGPADFITTNIIGTFSLLELLRKYREDGKTIHFHHVSTDEVFGSLDADGFFDEKSPYDPRSPYSASKASSDHLVKAYHFTYNIPVTLSNCSNNYGPYQDCEKLIPLMITNMLNGLPLPVYGNGKNIRDWLYVDDHTRAIWLIAQHGEIGATYTIGSGNEWENIALVDYLCEITASVSGKLKDDYTRLITFVQDRAGHDKRYALTSEKITRELGWVPRMPFADGLTKTVEWYVGKNSQITDICNT